MTSAVPGINDGHCLQHAGCRRVIGDRDIAIRGQPLIFGRAAAPRPATDHGHPRLDGKVSRAADGRRLVQEKYRAESAGGRARCHRPLDVQSGPLSRQRNGCTTKLPLAAGSLWGGDAAVTGNPDFSRVPCSRAPACPPRPADPPLRLHVTPLAAAWADSRQAASRPLPADRRRGLHWPGGGSDRPPSPRPACGPPPRPHRPRR